VGRFGFAGPTLSLDCKPEGPLAEALLVEDRQVRTCHGDLARGRSRVGLVRQSTGRSLITLLPRASVIDHLEREKRG
jgi:hypothetical protein